MFATVCFLLFPVHCIGNIVFIRFVKRGRAREETHRHNKVCKIPFSPTAENRETADGRLHVNPLARVAISQKMWRKRDHRAACKSVKGSTPGKQPRELSAPARHSERRPRLKHDRLTDHTTGPGRAGGRGKARGQERRWGFVLIMG